MSRYRLFATNVYNTSRNGLGTKMNTYISGHSPLRLRQRRSAAVDRIKQRSPSTRTNVSLSPLAGMSSPLSPHRSNSSTPTFDLSGAKRYKPFGSFAIINCTIRLQKAQSPSNKTMGSDTADTSSQSVCGIILQYMLHADSNFSPNNGNIVRVPYKGTLYFDWFGHVYGCK